jgi:hypothetical protein
MDYEEGSSIPRFPQKASLFYPNPGRLESLNFA